jgi:hypothetical protein
MIRSSSCPPWQPDNTGHARRRSRRPRRCYTTPRDTIPLCCKRRGQRGDRQPRRGRRQCLCSGGRRLILVASEWGAPPLKGRGFFCRARLFHSNADVAPLCCRKCCRVPLLTHLNLLGIHSVSLCASKRLPQPWHRHSCAGCVLAAAQLLWRAAGVSAIDTDQSDPCTAAHSLTSALVGPGPGRP